MRPPIYCIGGLGVDHRVFDDYRFSTKKVVIPYQDVHDDDTLHSYARRMAESITHEKPLLLGVSLGGILAQEIAAVRPLAGLVLASTIRHCRQVPALYRYSMRIGGEAGLGLAWKMDVPSLRNFMFTAETAGDRAALQAIYEATDYRLVRWALPRILRWQGVSLPDSLPVQTLHGAKDRLFPVSSRRDIDALHAGAGHFMVYSHKEFLRQEADRFISQLGI